MTALQFWKTVTKDESGFLESFLSLLEENKIRFCVIGGQGVNAYVDPLVSLDLDIVVAVDQLALVDELIAGKFEIERFPSTLNIRQPGSSLAVQIQTDPRYFDFPVRSVDREVLGMMLPVAAIEDVLQGKVWAAGQETRRPSKRRKDLLDIERLIESYPRLRERVPEAILARLGAW